MSNGQSNSQPNEKDRTISSADNPIKPSKSSNVELSEQELNRVSGGDGPPGTAGDGNGRVGPWSRN
jgi:hypothetical protein